MATTYSTTSGLIVTWGDVTLQDATSVAYWPDFQQRCTAAAVAVAKAVLGEGSDVDYTSLRKTYAKDFMASPEAKSLAVALAAALTGLAVGATDNQIVEAVEASWTHLAGIVVPVGA